MPAYTSAFVNTENSWRPSLPSLPDLSRVTEAGAAIGGAIVGGVTVAGEAVRTGVEAAQRGAHLAQQSVRDFSAGLPIAIDRINRAGGAIGESVQATQTALAGGREPTSEFVATSQTFGVQEALQILATGSAPGEDTSFRRRRDELEPLLTNPLDEKQTDIAVGIAVVVVAAVITAAAIPVGVAAVATAPIWVPIAIVVMLLGGGLGLAYMDFAFGEQKKWDVLGDFIDRARPEIFGHKRPT